MDDQQKKIAIGAAVGGLVGGVVSVIARGGMSPSSGAVDRKLPPGVKAVTLSPGWLHGSVTDYHLTKDAALRIMRESGDNGKLPGPERIRRLPDGREIAHYVGRSHLPNGYFLIKGEP